MASNTLLTPDQITRRALMVLHQKLNFVGNINRQYDSSFANDGAKIGDSLRIRLPNQYAVTTGATFSANDTVNTQTTLQVNNQKHVGMEFTTAELTMDIDDFSDNIIEPAMAVLAANIEHDALTNMVKDVYQNCGTIGTALNFKGVGAARKDLTDSLAPTSQRCMLLNTQDSLDLQDSLKGLFQDSGAIKKQYRDGMMGRTGGFDFFESTFFEQQERGAGASYQVNDASYTEGSASLAVDTGTGTIKAGETITIAGVNRVHAETKADTGELMQFVVTADHAGGAGTLTISPAPRASGARQNVTALPPDNNAITITGTASTNYDQSLAFHKDAFTFATADLVVPKGTDFASRQVYDGISLRLIRDYNFTDDEIQTRVDVLYGYKCIRPELATRVLGGLS